MHDWDGVMLYCTAESFPPQGASVEAEVRWLDWDADFALARRRGWQDRPLLSRAEWEQARRGNCRYAAAIVEGRIVSMAAEWRRAKDEWEVAAVGTDPDWRGRWSPSSRPASWRPAAGRASARAGTTQP